MCGLLTRPAGSPLLRLDGSPSLGDFYRLLTSLLPSPNSSSFCSSSSSSSSSVCCMCQPSDSSTFSCPSPTFDSADSLCRSAPLSQAERSQFPFIDNSLAEGTETLYDLWVVTADFFNYSTTVVANPPLSAEAMGTGSDYGGFLQHVGVTASDLRFVSPTGQYNAAYHSNYDDFRWMDQFSDPGFSYFRSMTQLLGTTPFER